MKLQYGNIQKHSVDVFIRIGHFSEAGEYLDDWCVYFRNMNEVVWYIE